MTGESGTRTESQRSDTSGDDFALRRIEDRIERAEYQLETMQKVRGAALFGGTAALGFGANRGVRRAEGRLDELEAERARRVGHVARAAELLPEEESK